MQFLSFLKMKVQDRQNGPLGLPEKTGWLRIWSVIIMIDKWNWMSMECKTNLFSDRIEQQYYMH